MKVWIGVSTLLVFMGQIALVLEARSAREANCQDVRDSQHVLVVELGESFGRGADDPEVVDLDQRVQKQLEECR